MQQSRFRRSFLHVPLTGVILEDSLVLNHFHRMMSSFFRWDPLMLSYRLLDKLPCIGPRGSAARQWVQLPLWQRQLYGRIFNQVVSARSTAAKFAHLQRANSAVHATLFVREVWPFSLLISICTDENKLCRFLTQTARSDRAAQTSTTSSCWRCRACHLLPRALRQVL